MKTILTAIILGMFSLSLLQAQGETDPIQSNLPETDFTYIPLNGIVPQIDFSKLFSLELNGGVLFVKPIIPGTYTYLQVMGDIAPMNTAVWPRFPDGSENASWLTDTNIVYSQLKTGWNVTIFQGLYNDPDYPVPPLLNILNLYAGYYGYFNLNYKEKNPGSYIYVSDREDRDRWLANVLKAGIVFNEVKTNRMNNIKRGSAGQVQIEWAPESFGNNLIGKTDFSRFSAYLSNNIPLAQGKDFSMYIFQRSALAIVQGDSIPAAVHYGNAAIPQIQGYGSLRQAILWDGLMYASNSLDIRATFPTAIESGIMPGLSIFCDFGIYDDYDYVLSFDNVVNSIGANLILHMDSATLIPEPMILDLQFGIAYSPEANQASFQFAMFLPQ